MARSEPDPKYITTVATLVRYPEPTIFPCDFCEMTPVTHCLTVTIGKGGGKKIRTSDFELCAECARKAEE